MHFQRLMITVCYLAFTYLIGLFLTLQLTNAIKSLCLFHSMLTLLATHPTLPHASYHFYYSLFFPLSNNILYLPKLTISLTSLIIFPITLPLPPITHTFSITHSLFHHYLSLPSLTIFPITHYLSHHSLSLLITHYLSITLPSLTISPIPHYLSSSLSHTPHHSPITHYLSHYSIYLLITHYLSITLPSPPITHYLSHPSQSPLITLSHSSSLSHLSSITHYVFHPSLSLLITLSHSSSLSHLSSSLSHTPPSLSHLSSITHYLSITLLSPPIPHYLSSSLFHLSSITLPISPPSLTTSSNGNGYQVRYTLKFLQLSLQMKVLRSLIKFSGVEGSIITFVFYFF